MIPAVHIAAAPGQVDAVRCLRDVVRKAAPSVQFLDWTERELPPSRSALPGAMALRKRNRTLDRQFFSFCADACMSADLVVCLGTGQESVIQAGMAYMAGIISIRPWEEVKVVVRAPACREPWQVPAAPASDCIWITSTV